MSCRRAAARRGAGAHGARVGDAHAAAAARPGDLPAASDHGQGEGRGGKWGGGGGYRVRLGGVERGGMGRWVVARLSGIY